MSVSYKKLWKLLIDKDMKKKALRNQQFQRAFGPSSATRTHGLLVPNQARYQLRYTRIFTLGLCRGGPGFLIINRRRGGVKHFGSFFTAKCFLFALECTIIKSGVKCSKGS